MTPTEDSRWIAPMPLDELSAPRVLLFAEPGRRADALAAIADVGASAQVPPDFELGADLIALRNHDAVLIELGEDLGASLDILLDTLDQAATKGMPGVVTLPQRMIDPVTARISAPGVTLLCEPEEAERRMALALALATSQPLLHDVGSDGAMRLRELSEEVGRIARTLATLSLPGAGGLPGQEAPLLAGEPETAIEASAIRTMIRARRLRGQFFDAALFADPAWDMLLDLTAARLEGTPVAVSSLCIAAAVPPTTALRWIKTLTDAGLLVRIADPRDRRRVFIRLSDDTAAQMLGYLGAAMRMNPGVI